MPMPPEESNPLPPVAEFVRRADYYHQAAMADPAGPHAGAFASASASLLQTAVMMGLTPRFNGALEAVAVPLAGGN